MVLRRAVTRPSSTLTTARRSGHFPCLTFPAGQQCGHLALARHLARVLSFVCLLTEDAAAGHQPDGRLIAVQQPDYGGVQTAHVAAELQKLAAPLPLLDVPVHRAAAQLPALEPPTANLAPREQGQTLTATALAAGALKALMHDQISSVIAKIIASPLDGDDPIDPAAGTPPAV